MNTLFKLHLDNLARPKQSINLVKNEDEATLYVYDIISSDWGVSAMSVIDAITQASGSKTLNIRINSPGGDVFESRAIMAAISRFPGNTIAHIDGLCASAATSISLACKEVAMSDGGFYMIHNASGMAWGDKTALRDTADLLEKVEGVIVTDYTSKTGKAADEVVAMMEAETWMTAQEALDNGFIDRITDTKSTAKNLWNLSAFTKPPMPPPDEPNTTEEPAPVAGFFMSVANANHLRLLEI